MKKYSIYISIIFFSNLILATPLEDHGFLDIITNQSTTKYTLTNENETDTSIPIEPLGNETPIRKSFSILGNVFAEAGYRQFELSLEDTNLHINKKNKSLTGDNWEIESSITLNINNILHDNHISIKYPSDPNWYVSVTINPDNTISISKFIISGKAPMDTASLKKYTTVTQ